MRNSKIKGWLFACKQALAVVKYKPKTKKGGMA